MTLSSWWALLLLPLPWLVFIVLPQMRVRTLSVRVPFFSMIAQATNKRAINQKQFTQKQPYELLALTLIWCCLVFALAEPVKLGKSYSDTVNQRDMMLAIDLSGSMDEVDFSSQQETMSRLDGVKRVVKSFIFEREGDRVGLIVFGTRAYLQVPFTHDLMTATQVLNESFVAMAGPHTAIGDAIGLALKTFEQSNVSDKVLILLTDGADTGSSMSPVNAAHIAKAQGLKIFTIGIGDEAGDGAYRVDFDTLKRVSQITEGHFYYANDEKQLNEIYKEIDDVTANEVVITHHGANISYTPHCLLMALCVLLMSLAIHFFKTRKFDE